MGITTLRSNYVSNGRYDLIRTHPQFRISIEFENVALFFWLPSLIAQIPGPVTVLSPCFSLSV